MNTDIKNETYELMRRQLVALSSLYIKFVIEGRIRGDRNINRHIEEIAEIVRSGIARSGIVDSNEERRLEERRLEERAKIVRSIEERRLEERRLEERAKIVRSIEEST